MHRLEVRTSFVPSHATHIPLISPKHLNSTAGSEALGGPGLRGAERRREVPAAGRLPAVPGPGGPSARLWSTLAPEASKRVELETEVIHIDLGDTQNGCDKCITQNSPRGASWARRKDTQGRLCGRGGKEPTG